MLPPRLECATALCPGTDGPTAHLVSGALRYMHYGSQGFADHGWGCGFRTVQTMLSWLAPDALPPSVPQLQRAVPGYAGGREWIGVPDAVSLLDILCCAPVRVRHVPARRPAAELRALEAELREHFDTGGGPVMVGGGGDVYSKTIVGVRGAVEGAELLVWDPHYAGDASRQLEEAARLYEVAGWVAWRRLDQLLRPDSFYNVGLPRRTAALQPSFTPGYSLSAERSESYTRRGMIPEGEPQPQPPQPSSTLAAAGAPGEVAECAGLIEVTGRGGSCPGDKLPFPRVREGAATLGETPSAECLPLQYSRGKLFGGNGDAAGGARAAEAEVDWSAAIEVVGAGVNVGGVSE